MNKIKWGEILAYATVIIASIGLRIGFPIYAMGGDALFDDGLYFRLAKHIRDMEWLGPYDNLTLARGPFFPFFVAASNLLHVPLKIAEQSLYLAAALLTSIYVARISNKRLLGLILFTVLALNPVFWHPQLSRIIRENIYISLSLAVVALTLAISFPSQNIRSIRPSYVLLSIIAGVTGGCYWLTREEGIWLAPAVATILAIALLHCLLSRQSSHTELRFLSTGSRERLIVTGIAAMAISSGAVVLGVRLANQYFYGTAVSAELTSAAFVKAYGALSRIKHDNWHRYVVFPKDARLRAYSVSAAARELEPYLEGETGEDWSKASAPQVGLESKEIGAGWFLWAFRDAVYLAGHYRSAEDAIGFYDRLASEINAACNEKTIPCLAERSTLAPPFRPDYIVEALNVAPQLFSIVSTLGDGKIGSPPSTGTTESLREIESFTGAISAPIQTEVSLKGWVASANGTPRIIVMDANGTKPISIEEAPDVKVAYPNMESKRFQGKVTCQNAQCSLAMNLGEKKYYYLLAKGAVLDSPETKIFVDTIYPTPATLQTPEPRIRVKIAEKIAYAYSNAMPILEVLAVIGTIIGFAAYIRGAIGPEILALTVASLTAALTRIAFLSYLEVSAMPGVNVQYSSPATPFVLTFTVLGIYLGMSAWCAWRLPPKAKDDQNTSIA